MQRAMQNIKNQRIAYYFAGERICELTIEAIMFKVTWNILKEHYKKNPQRIDMSVFDIYLNIFEYSDTEKFREKVLNYELSSTAERVKILIKIENELNKANEPVDLLNCGELALTNVLASLCRRCQNVSIRKYISTARIAFMNIGHRHRWCDSMALTDIGRHITLSGNPVTNNIFSSIKKV